ncbi:MAG: Asp-tRNA(Asn)/Glu-tRNA(Gln) amidotransferase subunit GatA [Bacteroidota bacterium]|nr:Asp-tRNA(Asn)/Glu-tRNA(Gln) amidotransferase subunit GatA [Bacteroidota bacterium]
MNLPSSFSEINQLLIQDQLDLEDICKHYIQKIEHSSTNSFIEIFKESALKKASEVNDKIKNKNQGALAGMIIGIKDNICYKDHEVTASSKMLNGFNSVFNATAVRRLLEEDAIIIGRLNCDEFAMGSSNENSFYGPVKHHLDETRVPGGSSGGSAVAVAEGLCMASLGSDTGGSIRQPASFCGVIGMKPSYGRISRNGLLAYASSFDQIGVFSKHIEDVCLLTHILSGKDEFDSTLASVETHLKKIEPLNNKMAIGIPKDYLDFKSLDPEIKIKTESVIEKLKRDGHQINYINFPFIKHLVPCYYVLTTAEASSNLARYDGAHYGFRSENANDINSTYELSRTEGFGLEVKRRIMLGNFVLSSGYYDAYFTKAQKVRKLIKEATEQMLKENDILLFPTTPTTAFKIGEINDPIQMYLQDIFTVHANIVGVPAVSLPMGQHSNNLPFGVQLMSSTFKEDLLYSASQYILNM